MKALNGWQRIWVVIAVLTIIPTLISAIDDMPTNKKINRIFADKLIGKSLELNDFKNFNIWDIRSAYSDMTDKQLIEKIIAQHGEKMEEQGLSYKDIPNENSEALNNINRSRLYIFIQYLGGWIAVVFGIYIFGWTIGWVIRGFRKDN